MPADYLTDVRAPFSQRHRDAASPDKPFVLWITPAAPHVPVNARAPPRTLCRRRRAAPARLQ
jgi:hypothetical protein